MAKRGSNNMKYIVCLEKVNAGMSVYISNRKESFSKTLIEKNAKRYPSVCSATFGLAHARRLSEYPYAEIIEVKS
jgi:hypothetical protein